MTLEIASGIFYKPDQGLSEALDDYVPANIPFQPAWIEFTLSFFKSTSSTGLYGGPSNSNYGDIWQGISTCRGYALFGAEDAITQGAHFESAPWGRTWGNETHYRPSLTYAFGWYGPNFFILPGFTGAKVKSYTEVSPGVWDFTISYAAPLDGIGSPAALLGGAQIRWTAYGGSDITNVALINWQVTNNLSPVYENDITTIGFKPDYLESLIWGIGDAYSNGLRSGMSFCNCQFLQQMASYYSVGTFVAPSESSNWQETDCIGMFSTPSAKFILRVTQMLSNGFKVEVSNPNEASIPGEHGFLTLAVKGISSQITKIIQPGTTVDLGDVVNPRIMKALSTCTAVNETGAPVIDGRRSYGEYIKALNQQWCYANDAYSGQYWDSPFLAGLTLPWSGNAWSTERDDRLFMTLYNGGPRYPDMVDHTETPTASELVAAMYATDFDTLVWPLNTDGNLAEIILCILGEGGVGTCEGAVFLDLEFTTIDYVYEVTAEPELLETNIRFGGGTPEINPPIKPRPDGKPILSPTPTVRRVLPTQ